MRSEAGENQNLLRKANQTGIDHKSENVKILNPNITMTTTTTTTTIFNMKIDVETLFHSTGIPSMHSKCAGAFL